MSDLVTLLVLMLSCYGGANGIVFSRLLMPLRLFVGYKNIKYNEMGEVISADKRTSPVAKFLNKLINCPLCVGFWLGIIFSLTICSPCANTTVYGESNYLCVLFDGFLGSAGAWIMHLLFIKRMEGA